MSESCVIVGRVEESRPLWGPDAVEVFLSANVPFKGRALVWLQFPIEAKELVLPWLRPGVTLILSSTEEGTK
jgi:hypothetical protein